MDFEFERQATAFKCWTDFSHSAIRFQLVKFWNHQPSGRLDLSERCESKDQPSLMFDEHWVSFGSASQAKSNLVPNNSVHRR